jgi:hypothetical protein
MSQTEEDLKEYRGTAGSEVKTADVAGDDHALNNVIGDDEGAQERMYDPKLAGERFVEFYDDSAAAIREYLSNAETACIRRAKQELLDAGFTEDEIPGQVTEMLEMAKEETGYEPLIEVTYNRQSDATRLIIEDNGIGISSEEYQVVQRVGYSASHMDGERLGQFGMGWLSGFQLTSVNGVFRMKTKSYLTDEAYSTAEYVANFEMLDGEPDEYGTRFEFPGFGEKAKSIDIPSKVSDFANGMVIPVLYRDFDSSGDETSHSDDFLPRDMADDYPDDSLVVAYENEFFRAVMSPDRPENRRNLVTYNVSMPIRRNCDQFGSEPKFGTPWKWDFRGKKENGPIVACESDPSVVGLIPKEDSKYERLVEDFKEDCIRMSEVPDDAVKMPEPASSRDSYKSGHDEFWQHVSEKLTEAWGEIAKERFDELDSVSDFRNLDTSEKRAVFRAYSQFGPSTTGTEPDKIQDMLNEKLGVTVPTAVCKFVDRSRRTVNVVSRGSNRAHTKSATRSRKIWKVIEEAPDGVYMGKTISQKKAEIVWGLGETHLVRVEDRSYTQLEKNWGWTNAKTLPTRNLKEKLPELDDDVAEKYEDTSTNDSNNTKSIGGNGKDPKKYKMRIRYRTNSRKYFTTDRVENIVDDLENSGSTKVGYYSAKDVILHSDNVSATRVAGSTNRRKKVAATRIPEYVYEYLEDKDHFHESMDEVRENADGMELTFDDGTTESVSDLSDDTCLIVAGNEVERYFDGRPEELIELHGYDADAYDRIEFVDNGNLQARWDVSTDATVIKTKRGSNIDIDNYDYYNKRLHWYKLQDKLGGMDSSSDEYDALFGKRRGKPSGSELDTLIQIAKDAGLTDDQ